MAIRDILVLPLRSSIFADSRWLLTDRCSRLLVGVAVNIALARTLGAGEFGLLATALSLASLFMPLSTLGGERILIRELACGNLTEADALVSFGSIRILGGVVGCLLATFTAWVFVVPDHPQAIGVVLVVAAGNVLLAFDTLNWVFQARGDFRSTTLARLAAFLGGAAIKIVLVAVGAGLQALAVAVFLEVLITAFAQFAVWRRKGGRLPTRRFNMERLKLLLLAGAPLLVAEVAVWVFQRLDLVLLTSLVGVEAAGWYAVAQRLAQVGYFLPVLLVQVLSPTVARVLTDEEALAIVQRAANFMVVSGIGLSGLLALVGGPLLELMFGSEYGKSTGALAVLAWSNVFVFLGCSHSLYLVNRHRQGLTLRLTWITAVASLLLNLILIPQFDLMGAAWASVLAYAITTLTGVALFRDSRPLFWVNIRAILSPFMTLLSLFRGRQPSVL